MAELINRACWAHHLGLYAIEPIWLRGAVSAIKSGTWPILEAARRPATEDAAEPYVRTQGGVAVIGLNGPMMKGTSKYPHVNTLDVRRALRAAARDEKVGAVMLQIDSPGGMVAGTEELAADVRAVGATKPVFAHFDDLGASAAYWVASGATRITANATAEVGSIGVVASVEDTSAQYAMDGVKVHVVSTGPFKGAFADGTEITDDHLEYLKARVAEIGGHFLEAVRIGRKLDGKRLEAVSDGRVWGAPTALKMGLIDGVESWDEALSVASAAAAEKAASRGRASRVRADWDSRRVG